MLVFCGNLSFDCLHEVICPLKIRVPWKFLARACCHETAGSVSSSSVFFSWLVGFVKFVPTEESSGPL